jgi:hypothetical protein
MSRWYYTLDNKQRLGPVTSEEFRALAVAGTIRPDCLVMPEGGGKWIPAGKVKGLFPKPAPTASRPAGAVNVPCPGCGRTIPLQQHELSLVIQCAKCGTQFTPSQPSAQGTASSTPLDGPVLLGLVKDAEPERLPNEPLRNARTAPRGSRILADAVLIGVLLLCVVVGIGFMAYRGSAKNDSVGVLANANGVASTSAPPAPDSRQPAGQQGRTDSAKADNTPASRPKSRAQEEGEDDPVIRRKQPDRRADRPREDSKPAPKPPDKPANKPTDRPADTPADKPAGTKSAENEPKAKAEPEPLKLADILKRYGEMDEEVYRVRRTGNANIVDRVRAAQAKEVDSWNGKTVEGLVVINSVLKTQVSSRDRDTGKTTLVDGYFVDIRMPQANPRLPLESAPGLGVYTKDRSSPLLQKVKKGDAVQFKGTITVRHPMAVDRGNFFVNDAEFSEPERQVQPNRAERGK